MKLSKYTLNSKSEITNLFIETFTDSEGESEGRAIGDLVKTYFTDTEEEDFLCFVAKEGAKIVSSVFFTKLRFKNDIRAYILSPMATLSKFQGRGIGQKLIRFGLDNLREIGVEIVVTYGDPNFYSKVGFQHISEDIIKAPLKLSMPEGWLGQSLTSDNIKVLDEKPTCVSALNKPELW